MLQGYNRSIHGLTVREAIEVGDYVNRDIVKHVTNFLLDGQLDVVLPPDELQLDIEDFPKEEREWSWGLLRAAWLYNYR